MEINMLIIAAVLAGVVYTGPKLTPTEAVKVLQASKSDRDRTGAVVADGPVVVINRPDYDRWLNHIPDRRLDGTLKSDPPTVYGFRGNLRAPSRQGKR